MHPQRVKKKDETKNDKTKNDNKTGMMKEPGKNTNCQAEIIFNISAPCNSKCQDFVKNKYPLEIKLYYIHNHAIAAADALRYRPVSEETKQLFIDLFNEDVSPSSAYRRVIDHLDNDTDHTFAADRFHVPDYKWVFNFHAQYIKERFGSSNGADIFKNYRRIFQNTTQKEEELWQRLNKQIKEKP